MNEINIIRVSVTEPVSDAIRKTKEILFAPFDIVKWLTIGFCAWLAYLGEGGGFNGNFNFQSGEKTASDAERFINDVMANLPFVLVIGSIVLLVIVGLTVLFSWLKSRGKFMFVHCVALNVGEVKVPWGEYVKEAHSLFLFYLVLALLGFVCFIPFSVLILFMVIAIGNNGMAVPIAVMVIICTAFVMAIVGILFALVGKFTNDFVVPIMYLHGMTCMDGWREFKELLSMNKGRFALYILFHIVLSIAIGIIILSIVFMTCCCAGCFFAIPIVGTVLLLPIFVFKRSYSLYYLAQYGRDLNVFVPHDTEDTTALPELVQ